jgi:hypothetical protein
VGRCPTGPTSPQCQAVRCRCGPCGVQVCVFLSAAFQGTPPLAPHLNLKLLEDTEVMGVMGFTLSGTNQY